MSMERLRICGAGYDEGIPLGSLDIYVFPEGDLKHNLPPDDSPDTPPIILSATDFPSSVPCVKYSELIIEPQGERLPQRLSGTIAFAMPPRWNLYPSLGSKHSELARHLHVKLGRANTSHLTFNSSREQLRVEMPSGEAIIIRFDRTDHAGGFVRVSLPLASEDPSLYNNIRTCAGIWGGIHDFIIQSDSDIAYTRNSDTQPGQILVGTTARMTISGAALAIESYLAQRKSAHHDTPLPPWGTAIDHQRIDRCAAQMPQPPDLGVVAARVVTRKLASHANLREYPITTEDIIAAMQLSSPE